MPGVTSGLPTGAVAALMALPEGNKYRLVAEERYRPRKAGDDAQWQRAVPVLVEILAADPKRTVSDQRILNVRRATLARHVYWVAGAYPGDLTPGLVLDPVTITRSANLSAGHRNSRSRASFKSQVASFRVGFPKVFRRRRAHAAASPIPASSDQDVALALSAAQTFRSRSLRNHAQALILLCRAAGLNGGDCRMVAGTDITRSLGPGLWVTVRGTRGTRAVPVLRRFAADLEALALQAGESSLIFDGHPPAPPSRPASLTDQLIRKLSGQSPRMRVTPGRLRKAWMLEQLKSWEKLPVFMTAAGVTSMRAVDELLVECRGASTDLARAAELLGGGG